MRLLFRIFPPQNIVETKTTLEAFNGPGHDDAELYSSTATTLEISDDFESPTTKEKVLDDVTCLTGNFQIHRLLWARYISIDAPLTQRLSHLSNEQTFLAWFSLANAMSSLGIVIAQISSMENALEAEPKPTTMRRALGKPQACICQLSAILILLIGAWRFLEHQNDILRGLTKFCFGGVYLTGIVVLLARLVDSITVSLCMFG
ncbi:hypothetical protein, variant [Exophiala oligosperma]|uniref:DUF202 domain-containing protein n=1 Tax=Exophiala oligosperma TaxID=215243 RepID=A0A0D2DZ65_9EURO|nr:hypothetical protein, variant [Exophiala oligosperma]KIW48398.1 hypothetical protein, variant [Exophiala oligosperma]